jgi:hypothetical protein
MSRLLDIGVSRFLKSKKPTVTTWEDLGRLGKTWEDLGYTWGGGVFCFDHGTGANEVGK